MDDPAYTWPAGKFGLKREDLSNKLHDQYNTYLAPIQSPEAFYHDISEIAHTAHSAAEFHHLAHGRRQQRLDELNDALESASFEIIGYPRLIETPQWEHAVQLFRTNSLDSLLQYFASYLPQEHRWHPLHQDSALSGADDSGGLSKRHTSGTTGKLSQVSTGACILDGITLGAAEHKREEMHNNNNAHRRARPSTKTWSGEVSPEHTHSTAQRRASFDRHAEPRRQFLNFTPQNPSHSVVLKLQPAAGHDIIIKADWDPHIAYILIASSVVHLSKAISRSNWPFTELHNKHCLNVMAETSLWDYIFMRTSIFVLHLIAPLSIVVSLILSLVPLPFQIPRFLKAWLILEALFYIFVYLPLNKHLQKPANHPTAPCRADRQRLFQQCHDNIPDAGQYLRRWFRDAPEHEIKRENVKEFFRWGFLNLEDSGSTYDDELEEYIEQLEELLERKLEPGRGDAKCLRMTLAKVEMLHRSLKWSPAKRLTYWHRPHTSKTKLPILFIHGIGVGLYPYVNFLAELNTAGSADGDVGIIAVEVLSVSSRITGPAMLKEEMCEEIHRILSSHGWENCVLVSHSYGSVVAAQLLRDPKISASIGPVVFIDPVYFLLHLPDVAYNFICRRPSETKEHLLSYFGSKDIGIAHTLFRRFFWADNLLWKEDLQDRPTAVVLASRDSIIDAKSIRAYLVGSKDWTQSPNKESEEVERDSNFDVIWFENLDHGQAFDYKTTRLRLVETVRGLCNEAIGPEKAMEAGKKRLNGLL
ncbi:ribose-phosphate pyrophosphokinase [Fusarium tjaetaba]|uniref:Ribose-phosphate pyrophosphokinase n=1 Tax=Fusarium tjaetaba TaxID=1567544 RepID=A0A8H5RBW2_9HYPO|nr:ribose-phosphate pyrophosphokinase [Fusarium tjaetaba]KAF5629998.1 ribose-phosphate pyrophosphokinase [Fusarium tjaetaba]